MHVKDAARAVRLAIQSEAALGQTINIGSGTATTLERLAYLTIELAEANLKPVIEGPLEDPLVFQADVRRARRLLQYEPSVSLADGLGFALQAKLPQSTHRLALSR